MRRTSQTDISHSRGRHGRRTIEEKSSRVVTEDIAEAEHFAYSKTEVSHRASWERGVNLGAVAVLAGVVLALTGVWTVPITLAGLTGAVVVLATVFVGFTALPPLSVSLAAWYLDVLTIGHQQRDRRTALTTAQRNLLKAQADKDAVIIDGEYRPAQVQQKVTNQALARQVRVENDLSVFAAAVFGRDEPLSFRHWKSRQLPSGKAVTHSYWRDNLVAPLEAVGAVTAPQAKGKTYTRHNLPLAVVDDKLRRAGYLQ